MYPWIVLLHVSGAFLFVISHGASAWAVIALRRETDARRIRTLADLSSSSIGLAYVGLLLLLVGGIWAGLDGGWFRYGWIWAALASLVIITVLMYAVATPYFKRLRVALGQRVPGQPKEAPDPIPLADSEIVAIAARAPSGLLAGIGLGGLLLILWLMVLKPF